MYDPDFVKKIGRATVLTCQGEVRLSRRRLSFSSEPQNFVVSSEQVRCRRVRRFTRLLLRIQIHPGFVCLERFVELCDPDGFSSPSRGRPGGGWGSKDVALPHPHPSPPLEGEGIQRSRDLQQKIPSFATSSAPHFLATRVKRAH